MPANMHASNQRPLAGLLHRTVRGEEFLTGTVKVLNIEARRLFMLTRMGDRNFVAGGKRLPSRSGAEPLGAADENELHGYVAC